MQCERCWSDEDARVTRAGPVLCGPCRAVRPEDRFLLESLFLTFASKKELLIHYGVRDGEGALERWAADQELTVSDATERLTREPGAMALFGREAVLQLRPRRRSAPFGYTQEDGALVPVSEEARVLADFFRMYQEGKSLRQIADVLNRNEVPTSRGGRWRASTIRHILRNPIYVGRMRRNGTVRDGGGPPPLVSVDLFEEVQKRLASRAKRAHGPV